MHDSPSSTELHQETLTRHEEIAQGLDDSGVLINDWALSAGRLEPPEQSLP